MLSCGLTLLAGLRNADEPEPPSHWQRWGALSEGERCAARGLGYDEEAWDDERIDRLREDGQHHHEESA
jgi:hypothetical protein